MRGGVVHHQRASAMPLATLAIIGLVVACDPTVLIGSCAEPSAVDAGGSGEAGTGGVAAGGAAAGGAATNEDAVRVPWATGFEDGLCSYHSVRGYCYARHDAAIEIVSSPVRTGRFAAAFTVNGNTTTADRSQARCVRQGALPRSATYGAYYRIPKRQTSDGFWNLFHFRGIVPGGDLHPLWDVSIVNDSDGSLKLLVRNLIKIPNEASTIVGVPALPIDEWVHIEFQLTRSAQANGSVTLRQDGEIIYQKLNLITDDTESGEWYLGNYAKTLVPTLSTIYVDDVSIREDQ